ncbi:MAG: hypothetical protein WC979_03155 [Candidatus Pacearchaeota archaeon]|jgi:hypothetical protein|nr:hypothetical protein [Clostridia bacterium]
MLGDILNRIIAVENLIEDNDYIDSDNKLEEVISDIETEIDALRGIDDNTDYSLSLLTKRLDKCKEDIDMFDADAELGFMFPNEEEYFTDDDF